MSKYRHALPQLHDRFCLTEGGLETTLIFHDKIDLPCFAAFDLLKDEAGTSLLENYYLRFGRMAREQGCGAVLETPTWRANPDWGARLGYGAARRRLSGTSANASKRGAGLSPASDRHLCRH